MQFLFFIFFVAFLIGLFFFFGGGKECNGSLKHFYCKQAHCICAFLTTEFIYLYHCPYVFKAKQLRKYAIRKPPQ